jgi:mercuric ion transport protein
LVNRALIGLGAGGAVLAAVCCATPVLALLLPALGLGAWLAMSDVIVMPLLLVGLGLVALGLYRRRVAQRQIKLPEESLKR